MLIRTWNLDRGHTQPPGARNHVREMVSLITAGSPQVVCLQDVPAWALGSVGEWGQMQAVPARARRPHLGPLPLPATAGHLLSAPHSGLLSPAFAGRGNVILIPREAKVRAVKTITLNTNVFCEERGAELGLGQKEMRRWERERRICHFVQYELPDRRRFLVATLHATSNPRDVRLADAELRRATNFVDRRAEVEEIVIVAGDFNVVRTQSATIAELESLPPESRWDDRGAHVDHVLLRGAPAASARVWSREERTVEGRLLSNHYPIEITIDLPARRAAAHAEPAV
jgi:endonuclease/exonuclease/phosphatase family metal-dependent hydrolase